MASNPTAVVPEGIDTSDWIRPRTPAGRARETNKRLAVLYPGTAVELCELDHRNPYELLVATILSAQCTDKRVNEVTPHLFARYPTPHDLAVADPEDVAAIIRPTGFFNAKTRSLLGMASRLVEVYSGVVPSSIKDLTSLAGVGRKTANVIRSVAMDLPGLPVDTHVGRLVNRLGITAATDPVKVELELNALLPATERGRFSLRVILHGRRVCVARKPRCGECALSDFCPTLRA